MSSAATKVTVDRIKKENNIRYHKTWNTGLSNMMGVYSLFFSNSKQYKALSIFNRVLSYIQDDVQHRMFTKMQDGEIVTDYEAIMEFDELAREFRLLFGTEPPEYEEVEMEKGKYVLVEKQRQFSYRDLMVPSPPEPNEDKVYIQRAVPIIYTWGNRPAAYVAFKIGFIYTITEYVNTPAGAFPIQKQIPMFSWDDPDIKAGRTKSNCVPYTYYQQQKLKLTILLMAVLSKLEAIIARYLHQEGYNTFTQQERPITTNDDQWVEGEEDDESDDSDTEEDEGANDE